MSDPRGRAKRPWLQRDFIVACLLVLAFNFFVIEPATGKLGRTPRMLGYMGSLRTLQKVAPDDVVPLAILGDSRSVHVSAESLCTALGRNEGPCLNLASVGGEWASVFSISRSLEPYLAEDALVVVGLSDYWLEAGNTSRLELLPRTRAYADLGHPELALASYLPMSVLGSGVMMLLHRKLRSFGVRLNRRFGRTPEVGSEQHARIVKSIIFHANVDKWFAPVSEQTRAEHLDLARRTFRWFSGLPGRVVLLYMPNAADREVYVDAKYPGRRARFFATLEGLAAEFGLPLVDLSGQMGEAERYRDFHHLKREQAAEVTALVAAGIKQLDEDG